METVRFQEVQTYRKISGKCPVCSKRVMRTRTFTHTINPFNKNKDGSIKDGKQVRIDIEAEADKWVPNFTHDKCRGNQ